MFSYKTFLFLLFMFSFESFAQEKRIKTKDVPKEIKSYIAQNFTTVAKIKYYQDKTNDTVLIEANFKYQKENYSLSFLPNGTLIEQEIEIKFDALASSTQINIKKYFNENFANFKVLKCQKVMISNKEDTFEVKIKQKNNYYEAFFDKNGGFLKYNQIIFTPINTQF